MAGVGCRPDRDRAMSGRTSTRRSRHATRQRSRQMTELRTERTLLRAWRDEDFEPFARLNADPDVRRWFPGTLTTEQSNKQAERLREFVDERGWGLWALEVPGVAEFCGFVGITPVPFKISFSDPADPAIEIGWRLAKKFW